MIYRDAENAQCKVVTHGNRAFFSGITADDSSGDIRTQTRQALATLDARVAGIGSDRSQVLTVHIWLRDMALFQDMTSVWNEWADPQEPPSRSCVSATPASGDGLLEIVASAAVSSDSNPPIERYGLVSGPGRPTMCLGLRFGDWYTVCLIAPDCTVGIEGQTQQILQMFDDYLSEVGGDKTRVLTAEIWLKRMSDREAVSSIWSRWLGDAGRPAVSCVRADMAQPEMLIEIRISAAVPAADNQDYFFAPPVTKV